MIDLPVALLLAAFLVAAMVVFTLSDSFGYSAPVWIVGMYLFSVAMLTFGSLQRALYGDPKAPFVARGLDNIASTIGAGAGIGVTIGSLFVAYVALIRSRA